MLGGDAGISAPDKVGQRHFLFLQRPTEIIPISLGDTHLGARYFRGFAPTGDVGGFYADDPEPLRQTRGEHGDFIDLITGFLLSDRALSLGMTNLHGFQRLSMFKRGKRSNPRHQSVEFRDLGAVLHDRLLPAVDLRRDLGSF